MLAHFLFLSMALAQTNTTLVGEQPTVAAGPVPIEHPLLYLVEKDGKKSYMLGSIHMGVKLDQLPSYVKSAIAASTDATFEIPETVSSLRTAYNTVRMVAAAFDFSSPKLSDRLSSDAWKTLNEKLGDHFPKFVLDHLKPSAVSLILGVLKEGKLPEGALDDEVAAYANCHGQHELSLETEAFQIGVLMNHIADTQGLENELEGLKKNAMADDKDDTRDYVAGDAQAMESKLAQQIKADPAMFQDLLVSRNADWIPKMKTIMNGDGQHFFTFGADHLFGDVGVLNLLEKQGYRVTRIDSPELYERNAGIQNTGF